MTLPRFFRSRWFLWPALAAVVAGAIAIWLLLPVTDAIQAMNAWVRHHGPLGILVYSVAYVAIVLAMGPTWAMSIAAGLVFGAPGFVVVLIAATIGASLAFLLSRYVFRARVEAIAKRRPLFAAVDRAVREDGWKIVVLLRLSPLVPFGLQNYLFGVTGIGSLAYVLATFFGIMPAAGLYVYFGTLGSVSLDEGAGHGLQLALLAAGLAASVAIIFIIGRRAKRRLREIGIAENQAETRKP